MAAHRTQPPARPPEFTDRLGFKPLAMLLLVPIVLVAGALLAVILVPPFAGIGWGAKALDARLTAEGADFTHIPRFPTRSTIYAADGKTVLATVYLDNRELVHLDDVSPVTREAVLAIEDSGFYQHGALNWNSMVRALVENAKAGTVVQGGSTITQQLVKNTLQNSEDRTFANKFQELAIAIRVEQKYTKDQVLELYLNQVYMGNGIYGIGTAADFYFHRPASKLTLTEGAMLAGMVRAPEYWNPLERPSNTKLRRNDVLNRMMALGLITPQRNEAAKAKPLGLAKHVGKLKLKPPPFFVTYMAQQIIANEQGEFGALGRTTAQRRRALYEGGLSIYTTLNTKWQAAAQAAAQQPYAVAAGNPGFNQQPDTSIVTVDNATGAIRTMLSGRNYDKQHLDLANTPHQPGSSFKPYVLAAAFEEGIPPTQTYSTKSPLYLPQWKGNACSCVTNAEGAGNEGYVDLYRATTSSINVVFAQLILDVGPEKVVKVAHQMGIESALPAVPSLAVGAVGITPIEHAAAFQTIANGGVHCTPYTVEKIVDADGTVYLHKPQCARVLPAGIANLIASMLVNVVRSGTGTAANLYSWPTAGKTGTAQDNTSVWFAGFTHQETTAVWVGFPGRPESLVNYFGQSVFGGTVAAPIWHAYMLHVMAGTPAIGFPSPPPVTTAPSPPPRVSVPDVVGKSKAAAIAALQAAGFGTNVQVVDATAARGTVVGQSPAGASGAPPGTIVTIQVSNGVAPVLRVPDVVGMKATQAVSTLEQAGYVVALVKHHDPPHAGIVIAQSPGGGTKAVKGTTVTIVVGKK
jgi:membrane peptidoglycan carboxypeptidase